MSKSFYKNRIEDKDAIYFTEENFGIKADGSFDVSDQFQDAIMQVVKQHGCGIVFVPEGTYAFSKTIYIPSGVRIFGYGENRPKFVLQDNAPDFNTDNELTKGGYRYLFWFVAEYEEPMSDRHDAHPGTFYSGMQNVDIELGEGNDYAVALRTHYAQNSEVSHINIEVMSGMAGIFDVGNFACDISINGGNYGIVSTKCSPGWPFVMTDMRFTRQKKAAIKSREVGWSILRTYASGTPKFIEVDEGYFEKIYLENCIFEDMNCVMNVAMDENALTQVNMYDCFLKSVESIAEYKDTKRTVANEDYQCKIRKYIHGTKVSTDYPEKQVHDQIYRYALDVDYKIIESKEKEMPETKTWTNAIDLGFVNDGETDNSDIIEKAFKKNKHIYFPQGEYVFTRPIVMPKHSSLIGLHSGRTRLVVRDNTEAFEGFGEAIGFVQTSEDNVISGLAIDAGGINPRIAAVEWNSKKGLMNDIKFYGGHGAFDMETGKRVPPYGPGRVGEVNPERKWDSQYPSLMIRDGGGTFKNIWTASPYASAGIYIEDTKNEIDMYAISLEHHVRNELVMKNVENAKLYGMQFEEDKNEGEFVLPIEMQDCKNVVFATVYCFRTVFVDTPLSFCAKTYNCQKVKFFNVHNFSQMKYTISNFLLDVNSRIVIRPAQAAMVEVNENSDSKKAYIDSVNNSHTPVKLFADFRFADGSFATNDGDFLFIDSLDKKLYKIDKDTLDLSVVFDSPYKINSVGVDTKDNLIIVGEYSVPMGATKDGEPIKVMRPVDSHGSSYHGWYDHRVQIKVFTLDHGKIKELDKVMIGKKKPKRVLYPGNRWRDGNDVAKILQFKPEFAFLAPDGCTIIPYHFDLIRATNLTKSKPGRKLYSVDELYNRVYMCEIDEEGMLKKPRVIINEGTYRVKKHNDFIYVGDDEVKVYKERKFIKTINVPKHPLTFDFGGPGKNILFITTKKNVYGIRE